MTLQYFQKLSEQKQYRSLLVEGVCVAERHCEGMMVLLFQLHYFYTEVHFHSETNELIGSRSFDDTDELQPYLQQIDLGSLLN